MYVKHQQSKSKRGSASEQPRPISGVIGKAIASMGLARSYNGWLVVTKWPEIVGDAIADQAEAVRFEDGCLFVAVDDSSWRQELSMRIDELLSKIHSYPFGKSVREIRLTQGRKGSEKDGDQGR